jgi:ribosomal protein S18 acetylase RimI-like enzyme
MYSVVEQNLRAAMRCYGLIGNGSEARDYPGLTVTSSGLDLSVFNSAMLTSATDNLAPLIATAGVHFRTRRLGWTFWLCEDLLSPAMRDGPTHNLFRSNGMLRVAQTPGMYTNSLKARAKPPAPITFRRVEDTRTRLEFAHIASVVFSLPYATATRIYGAPGLWQGPALGWVGYLTGQPVSVVTIVVAGDALGIYSLGTLPQHQGNGFGETLLRHAIEEARQDTGIERSVLQATAQGMNLYLRMGYRVVTRFTIFSREGCASF